MRVLRTMADVAEPPNSAPGRNRTGDLALRRHSLYPLSYRGREPTAGFIESGPGFWWRRRGSNPRPSHCERDALPTELLPRKRARNISSKQPFKPKYPYLRGRNLGTMDPLED